MRSDQHQCGDIASDQMKFRCNINCIYQLLELVKVEDLPGSKRKNACHNYI